MTMQVGGLEGSRRIFCYQISQSAHITHDDASHAGTIGSVSVPVGNGGRNDRG